MDKNQLFELQKAWFNLFNNSWIHFLLNTEVKDKLLRPSWKFEWVFYTHQDAFETNYTTQVSHTYTPNGNYAKVNAGKSTWDKCNRTEAEAEQEFYAFFIDLDKKWPSHPNAKDMTREDVIRIIEREKLPIQFMTETPWGWHMYLFIDPSDRKRITKKMFSDIQESFAFRMDADNLRDVSRVLRIPFSQYYGGWIHAWHVKLYSVDWTTVGTVELTEVTSPSQIVLWDLQCLTYEYLVQLHKTITEKYVVSNTAVEDRLFEQKGWAAIFSQTVNALHMTDIIKALQKYPRMNPETKMFEYFSIEWTQVCIHQINSDGEVLPIYYPDGYKYKIDENYINNFTVSKDIEERPRWGPYVFVHHWFGGNPLKLFDFFEKEFNLTRRSGDDKELYTSLQAARGVIDFSQTGVTYTITTQREWKTSTKTIRMTSFWCFPKALVKTKFMTSKVETANENKYILLALAWWEDILIPYHTDKKAFNKRHGSEWFMFIADEIALNDFYDAIWKAADRNEIPTYPFIGTNWFKKEWFVYWKYFFHPDATYQTTQEITGKYFWNEELSMIFHNKIFVEVDQFYRDLLSIQPRRIVLPSLLTYITGMLGIEFWAPVIDKINSTKIIPPLFLSGTTQAGKSTLMNALKEWFWVMPSQRMFATRSVSPQPLQQACADNVVLHIEEFTWDVQKNYEHVLREIINKNNKSRWNTDGTNQSLVYRANLIIDWEVLPTQESVFNRMIVVPFFTTDKKGTTQSIANIRQQCYLFDLIRRVYANWNKVEKYYLEWLEFYQKSGITNRDLELYSFLYVVNKILDLEPQEALLEALLENTAVLETFSKPDGLDEILSTVVYEHRIRPVIYVSNAIVWVNEEFLSVPLPYVAQSKYRIKLVEAMKLYPWAVVIQNSCLILYKNKIDSIDRKIDKFSSWALTRYI